MSSLPLGITLPRTPPSLTATVGTLLLLILLIHFPDIRLIPQPAPQPGDGRGGGREQVERGGVVRLEGERERDDAAAGVGELGGSGRKQTGWLGMSGASESTLELASKKLARTGFAKDNYWLKVSIDLAVLPTDNSHNKSPPPHTSPRPPTH